MKGRGFLTLGAQIQKCFMSIHKVLHLALATTFFREILVFIGYLVDFCTFFIILRHFISFDNRKKKKKRCTFLTVVWGNLFLSSIILHIADKPTRKALDELSDLFSYLRIWRIEKNIYIDALMPPIESYHRNLFFQVS